MKVTSKTDKTQNILDNDSFLSKWAEGIKAITPFQSARITYWNTYLMLIGILAGLVVSVFYWDFAWWIFIILLAALFNTIIVQLGNYQKYKVLRNLENLKGGKDE